MIEIIETQEQMTEAAFYALHPTKSFPQPLSDTVLAPFGARLVVGEEEAESLRLSLRAAINAWRDSQEASEIQFSHDSQLWDGGLKSRTRLQQVLALGAVPEGFFWTTANNVDVPMTYSQLQALDAAMVQAMVTQGWAIHQRQRAMKAQVETLPNTALSAYLIGW